MPTAACFALASVLYESVDRISVRIDFSDVIADCGHYKFDARDLGTQLCEKEGEL
jgi:hypothetical protein